jgi:hypothetical protein
MARYVYEVISTNIHNGNKYTDYFDSEKAANRWKEIKEREFNFTAEVRRWRVFSNKDI